MLQLADDRGSGSAVSPVSGPDQRQVERFNRYFRESFYNPLLTRMKGLGLLLDCAAANRRVRDWLADEANVRVHATLNERPIDRWRQGRNTCNPCHPVCGATRPPAG
uniref:Uncharacterized protein n=1 Tax=Klebsiella pneumoniae TaxID=573 RepID=A0A2P1BPQ8_KLEPN|nr:hypothetical protein [Klebsiella pneumoniae]